MREKRGLSKKRSSRKIWENRVKKAISRPKVGKHPQMGILENIFWKMRAQGVRGKCGGGKAGTLATPLDECPMINKISRSKNN